MLCLGFKGDFRICILEWILFKEHSIQDDSDLVKKERPKLITLNSKLIILY